MRQSQQRVFSLEEAELLVPFISNAFKEIFGLNEQARALVTDINDLLIIWGNEVAESGHIDNEIYRERIEKRNQVQRKAQEIFDEISGTGAVIKDTDTGLVDFYSKKGDELVMLCWKFGEDSIRFWHPLQGGFSRRKPISELKKQ